MKILHIIPTLRKGGAERLVVDILRACNQHKHIDARLVLLRNEIDYAIEDLRDRVQIIPASVHLSLWRKNRIDVSALQSFLEAFQPDVVHSHLFEAELVSRSCLYPKAKWFSHVHDNMAQLQTISLHSVLSKMRITNFFEKRYLFQLYIANQGNHFIAISKDTEQYLHTNVNRYPIYLLNNAIDYRRFYNKKERDWAPEKKMQIISVGSFVSKKNQQFLVQVAGALKMRGFSFELHFLGEGPLRKKVEDVVKEKELTDFVFFHGNVSKVEEYLWESDLYIHTAYYEPFGLVLLEAMAAGLPVISLDGKGNRDIIEDGKNGFMVFEENVDVFVDKILSLWSDKERYIAISEYAQVYARRFDITEYVTKLIQLYHS